MERHQKNRWYRHADVETNVCFWVLGEWDKSPGGAESKKLRTNICFIEDECSRVVAQSAQKS